MKSREGVEETRRKGKIYAGKQEKSNTRKKVFQL